MSGSWLPRDPGEPSSRVRDWWRPKRLTESGDEPDWAELAYVVVDELHDGVAGLVASPWPVVDELGRVRFGPEEESVRLSSAVSDLLDQLSHDRAPVPEGEVDAHTEDELRRRELVIGDVFAMRFTGGSRFREARRQALDVRGPILDITAEAREVAKTQAAATAAGVVDEDLLDEIARELGGGEDEPPPPMRGRAERKTERPRPTPPADIAAGRAETAKRLRDAAEPAA